MQPLEMSEGLSVDFQYEARQLLEMKRDAMLLATPRTSPVSMLENDLLTPIDSKPFTQKRAKGSNKKSLPQTPPLSDGGGNGPKPKRAQVKNACGTPSLFLFSIELILFFN